MLKFRLGIVSSLLKYKRRYAAATAIVIGASFATSSFAAEPVDARLWSAVQALAPKITKDTGTVLDTTGMDQLAQLLSAGGFNPAAADQGVELNRTLLNLTLKNSLIGLDKLTPLVSKRLQGFLLNRSGNDGLELGALLYPYMDQAGLCKKSSSATEGESVLCQFAFATDGANIAAVTDKGKIPLVSLTSTLGKILSLALQGNGGGISTQATEKSGQGTGSAKFNLLGLPLINAPYAYYYAYQYNCNTSCRGSVAGYGAIKSTYAAIDSDTIFAAAGAALYCNWECILGSGWDYLNGKNLVNSILSRGDKRYQEIHYPAKAVHAIVPACGTIPGSYAASVPHMVLSNTTIDLPYDAGVDIRFGTFFQRPNENNAGAIVFPNLDPGPPTKTHYKILNNVQTGATTLGNVLGNIGANVAVVGFEYSFEQLQSWSFDIIYAAAFSGTSSIAAACNPRIPASLFGMGNAIAEGDTVWFYQGFSKTNEDYDLPTISVGIGF